MPDVIKNVCSGYSQRRESDYLNVGLDFNAVNTIYGRMSRYMSVYDTYQHQIVSDYGLSYNRLAVTTLDYSVPASSKYWTKTGDLIISDKLKAFTDFYVIDLAAIVQ